MLSPLFDVICLVIVTANAIVFLILFGHVELYAVSCNVATCIFPCMHVKVQLQRL